MKVRKECKQGFCSKVEMCVRGLEEEGCVGVQYSTV